MKWGWRAENPDTWRFDDEWSVVRDWADNRWFVVRGGKWMLENHATAQAAIAEAERLMDGAK